MIEQYFFWTGLIANLIGFVGICGLLAWQALEWWIKFSDIRKPLFAFYAKQLKEKKSTIRG